MTKAYFRKAGHACGMDKKEHTLVNLGQLGHEPPLPPPPPPPPKKKESMQM